MVRRVVTLVLLTVCCAATALARGGATRVVLVMPTDPQSGSVRPGYSVTARERGSCWTASISSSRSDAWRCMSGNEIHDPCYAAKANANVVYCPEPTNGKHLVAIALAKPLPVARGNRVAGTPQGPPSRIILSGGVTCTFMTGATGLVAGMRINYGCSDGRMLIGDVDRHAPRWRIFAVAANGRGEPTYVDIDTAMY
ncbi:MAG TPA: hypothetical protein VFB22_02810 [Candidatus Baltobacteraceae bacterium]|nr:hypothetical protein [Candidatus Baltobacteraceae bacterium]